MQRYFDSGNKLTQDSCALASKDAENDSIFEYNTFNQYDLDRDCSRTVQNFALDHPNLRFRNGYGIASTCTIDQDSAVRYGVQQTHDHTRQQLCTRVFSAVPDFSRGAQTHPGLESQLVQGADTFVNNNECLSLGERQTYYPTPLVKCMQGFITRAGACVPLAHPIGVSSKDEYLRQCQTQHT